MSLIKNIRQTNNQRWRVDRVQILLPSKKSIQIPKTCQSQKTMNIPQRKHQNSAPLLQPVRIQPSKRFIFATHALLQIPIMRIVRMIVVCLSASVMLVQNVAMKHWVMMWSILGWDLRIATVLLWRREAA